jgi:GTP-binding protein
MAANKSVRGGKYRLGQRGAQTAPRPERTLAASPPASYQHAQLLQSAALPAQFPTDEGAEVAIAGRSNAGKSSAINAITGRHALARTSKTPGRTRLLNFFQLTPLQRLVDLPGYGYAAGPQPDRSRWAALVDALILRRTLRGLILVVDARRGVQAADEQLLAWAEAHARPVHILLAKADQLKSAEARALLASCRAHLSGRATVQLFSAHDSIGIPEARERMEAWLQAQPSAAPEAGHSKEKAPEVLIKD